MPSNHALYHLPCREEDSVSLCPTSLTVLQHQVTVRSFQQNLFNNSSLGLENWDPHVTHNEGAYDTNLQLSAQIIIGCWRVMNLNDLTWVGREKLRLGLESLLRRFTLVPLCKFDALLICFYTVRKEGSHTNMGTAFMFYACESATTAMFLTIIQKAV